MFLCKMDKQSERVRVVDSFDTTLSLETSSEGSAQVSSIDINVQPIVFRISYRDIMLAMSIVNRAIELSSSVGDQSKREFDIFFA